MRDHLSILLSALVGGACGLVALGLTSLPLFALRPSPFVPNPNADNRVEVVYWLMLGALHALATWLVWLIAGRTSRPSSATARAAALLLAFLSLPVCVGVGISLILTGGLGELAIVLAPLAFGTTWGGIHRLVTGRWSLGLVLVASGIVIMCLALGHWKYVVLFATTNALLCGWRV